MARKIPVGTMPGTAGEVVAVKRAMNKPEHTPGPWMTCSGMVETVPTDAPNHERCGIPIAYMDRKPGNGTRPVERDANARLIAAAPDLLAALEAWPGVSASGAEYKRLHDWLDNIVAPAIRKATGQEG